MIDSFKRGEGFWVPKSHDKDEEKYGDEVYGAESHTK